MEKVALLLLTGLYAVAAGGNSAPTTGSYKVGEFTLKWDAAAEVLSATHAAYSTVAFQTMKKVNPCPTLVWH